MRLKLEAIEDGRIVARGDHNSADRANHLHGKRNRRGRRRFWRQDDLKSIPGEHFGDSPPKRVRKKPPIIPDHDFLGGPVNGMPEPIIRPGLGYTLNIGKSEILSNDRSPPISPEFNSSHAISDCL